MATTVFERHPADPDLVERALSGSRRGSFWLVDAPGERFPALGAGTTCDLAVVGGGYLGLWTALLARQREPGLRVLLLEAGTVGWAASGRNGGFCEASLTHGEENGRARWPEEYDELERLGLANLDAIEKALLDLGIEAEFERNGSLDVATEPHQVGWLREAADDAAARGDRTVRFLDADAVRAEVRSPTYRAGLWRRHSSALVHPARLAAGLARAASEAGVEIVERTRVTGLSTSRGGGPVTLYTPGGTVRADRVALATNVFPSLLRRNRRMTVPVYDYVLMSEPLSPQQREDVGWRSRQGIGDVANQFHYYRLSADDRILFGGYDAIYPVGGRLRAQAEERPESFRRLATHFFTTFPQLSGLRFSHRWAGPIDTCTRFCAFTGLARGGRVAYASGFTGLGVAATRFYAEVMLDRLEGQDTERTRLRLVRERPLPFPPEPFATVGINATRWSLDRADHREGRRNLLLRGLDAAGLGFDS